ncbi:hypothetical protein LCGC14_3012870, partial [marine sediment metagenome]
MEHRIYKRNCNNCGKYYEGRGKLYCGMVCKNRVDSPFKKGHKLGIGNKGGSVHKGKIFIKENIRKCKICKNNL